MEQPRIRGSADTLQQGNIGSTSTEIDAPTLRVTRDLLAAWKAACGAGGELPAWRRFSPASLGSLMPFVYVLEKHGAEGEFRVRFMGSAIAQSVGEDYTGAVISENSPHASSWRADIYKEVLKRKSPMFTAVDLGDFNREYTKTECVLLPVTNREGDLSMVVCAAAPYPAEPK